MKLVIIGAGAHGEVVANAAIDINKYEKIIFLDDDYIKSGEIKTKFSFLGNKFDVLGKTSDFFDFIDDNVEFYPAIGDNKARLDFENRIEQSGGKLAKIIHPTAYVANNAEIADGTVVLANATVNVGTVIKKGCIINMGAIVDHGATINEGVHIDCGAVVGGRKTVESLTKIEAGTAVK